MDGPTSGAHALSETARAERVYLHYALSLAALFAISGAILAVLGLGDRLDVVMKADGGVNARLLNAAPGLALCLAAVLLFAFCKPGRMNAALARSAVGDELDQRIERAIAARIGLQSAVSARAADKAHPPGSMLNHVAGSLADALEQSALEALVALQKGLNAAPAAPDARKPAGPANADT